jgi:hypothetical protein
MSESMIAERVAAGAAFLDERKPRWADGIGLDHLDIGSECNCVLGQSFGGYVFGKHSLGLTDRETVALGFTATGDEENLDESAVDHSEYPLLTAEWKRLIEERRQSSWWDRTVAARRAS